MAKRARIGNLPAEWSSFVGREAEIPEVARRLSTARLVTLTGVGGVGKSRLSVQVARRVWRGFPDGVWLVELANLRDPVLLPQAVSGGFGLVTNSAADPVEVLTSYVADRRLLLVLDNCEHLVPALARLVVDLLRAAPAVRILTTSREVLRVVGEHVFVVAPLEVPDATAPLAEQRRGGYAGVALFADRAGAADPRFELTDGNVAHVTAICQRLDGIPLAIEFAAARVRTLSPAQILAGLDDRFSVVYAGTSHDGPARHPTLRAAMEWSFELCAEPERLLWMRASVFAGRFDLAAVERICAGDGLDVEDVLAALVGLVEKSVLVAEGHDEERRYRMLDTVRAYGLEWLGTAERDGLPRALGEEVLRRRHRDWYLAVAEELDADWFGPRQVRWSRRMRADLPELRVALDFCLTQPDEQETAVQLAGALAYFWYGCGELREGAFWLGHALASDTPPNRARMRAEAAYGRVLICRGEALAAQPWAQASLEHAQQLGDPSYEVHALKILSVSRTFLGDKPGAYELADRAMRIAERVGETNWMLALPRAALATLRFFDGDLEVADALYKDALEFCRTHPDLWWMSITSGLAAPVALALGDRARAAEYVATSMRCANLLRDTFAVTLALELLAWIEADDGAHRRATRLLGAADTQWRAIGQFLYGVVTYQAKHQACEDFLRAALEPADFDAEFARGGNLTLDEAVAYALDEPSPPSAPSHPPSAPVAVRGQSPLTRRETEIAVHIAEGITNKEIAARLFISQRTAESHVENIMTKLGFTSRAQIAVWQTRQHESPP